MKDDLTPAEQFERFSEAWRRLERRVIEIDHERHEIPIGTLEYWMSIGFEFYRGMINIVSIPVPDEVIR